MSAAVIAGHCYGSYWAAIGDGTPVPEEAIVMLGVRELSPEAERERLQRSGIQVVGWQNSKPTADLAGAFDELAQRVDDVYVHIDLDAFDPEVAPGVVDEPVPDGIGVADAEVAIRAAAQLLPIRAVTLATFNPERDRGDRTLRTALEIIGLVGEIAARY
jgi:arginase family enzyme